MVDRNNLPEVNDLYAEYTNLTNAVANLAHGGGHITTMTISGSAAESATVPTSGIITPPQMMDSIKNLLMARLNDVHNKLLGFGLGLEPPPSEWPVGQRAARPRRPR